MISLVTQPIGFASTIRSFKNRLFRAHMGSRGPSAVLQSLERGLTEAGVAFNVNPSQRDIGDIVIVLSSAYALRQIIRMKRKGSVRKIFAGPNIVVLPHDHSGIILAPEVDIILVPSEWVRIAYEEESPGVSKRIRIWYAGVDVSFWSRSLNEDISNNVIVYQKLVPDSMCEEVEVLLRQQKLNPIRIRYGLYTQDAFRDALQRSRFAIFFSQNESQGIALAEAWAMNVPTFVWNPGKLVFAGRTYSTVSSAPYLTPYTGKMWQTFDELRDTIKSFNSAEFTPLNWVQQHMTDIVSAKKMLSIIK